EKGGGDVNPSFSQWDLFVVVKRWSRGGGGGHGNSRNPGHHISTLSFFSRFTARAFSALVCPSVISPLSTHTTHTPSLSHTHTHTLSLSLSLSHTHTHTHTRTHTHTQNHTHTPLCYLRYV